VGLIQAFHNLKNKERLPHKLVIAGKKGWLYREIFKTVDTLGLAGDVKFTGHVPWEDLPFLYNLAEIFVYPSFYEGFGLPPVESMACGCPVITSNTSSLPEVVGDAGILIDPRDKEGLSKAIHETITDDDLRRRMRTKGLQRAKRFSWERCARETLKVYEEVYEKRKVSKELLEPLQKE
jgi:glycosyltransferase involved in cell wall biosynthesis